MSVAAGTWGVRTFSGSRYLFTRDRRGRWWLRADNVANPYSRSLGGRRYPIARPQPWPPRIGESLLLRPPPSIAGDLSHPARLPGGGKVTSGVVRVVTARRRFRRRRPDVPTAVVGDLRREQ